MEKYHNKMKEILLNNNVPNIVLNCDLEEFSKIFHENIITDEFKFYRYVKADYFNIRSFETEKLYFSMNGKMNDVFEGIPYVHEQLSEEKYNALHDLMFMKCFSETNQSNIMWSHYADEYRGICIEYDFNMIKQNDDILSHFFPVVYCENRHINVDIEELLEEKKIFAIDVFHDGTAENLAWLTDLNSLFLIKGEEWSYEKEWRLLYDKYTLYKEYKDITNYNIPFEYATGVYLGYRTPKMVKKHIWEITERINVKRKEKCKQGIDVYISKFNDRKFKIEFEKVEKENDL